MILKKIKPMFNGVIVTKDRYTFDDLPKSTLIDPSKMEGSLKEHQRVLFVGTAVRDINVGDLVKVNPLKYAVWKDKRKNSVVQGMEEYNNEIVGYNIPTIEIDGKECMYLRTDDIEYIVEEWEEDKDEDETVTTSGIILPNNKIMVP